MATPIITNSTSVVNDIEFSVDRDEHASWVQYRITPATHNFSVLVANFDKLDNSWVFLPRWSAQFGCDLDDARIIAAAWQVAIALTVSPVATPDAAPIDPKHPELGDAGTMTVTDANASAPYNHHTFYYGPFQMVVTGIEPFLAGYLLHNPDYPDGISVDGKTLLNYKRNAPPPAPDYRRARGVLAQPVKLTAKERAAMETASMYNVVYSSGSNINDRIYWRTFDSLLALGLLEITQSNYYHRRAARITDAGRAALDGVK